MVYYIILVSKQTGETTYLEYYDTSSGELITTNSASERQEYLSKESLMEDINSMVDDQNIINNYMFEIKGY